MSFVTLHGLSSTTFRSPPLDGSLLFPDMLEYQAQHSHDHTLFVYPAQSQALGGLDGLTALEKLTWSKAIKVFRRVGHLARASVETDGTVKRAVVAILALTDQITYLSLIAGLMLAGYIPFPLSPRNSDAAIVHLQSSGCHHLMVSSDPAMQTLAATVTAHLPELQTLKLPSYREIFEPSEGILDTSFERGKASLEETVVYMHSSGMPYLRYTVGSPRGLVTRTCENMVHFCWGAASHQPANGCGLPTRKTRSTNRQPTPICRLVI
ncbi:hypothetical protein C8F01DRAFT_1065422 [Mycena amicta]|nr:hypothetical protein C8F01DRAFT_1065422 [Mycena amicta]